jgi:hypothetical protein
LDAETLAYATGWPTVYLPLNAPARSAPNDPSFHAWMRTFHPTHWHAGPGDAQRFGLSSLPSVPIDTTHRLFDLSHWWSANP